MHQIKIEHFEGPFDLLLQLIEQEKLDVTKVTLAHITEDYIRILNDAQNILPDELADFLFIAAKLLLIKSKALMPYLVWDEEEGGEDLEHQLRMYKEYFEASKNIQKLIGKKHFLFYREKFLVLQEGGFHPPQSLTSQKLAVIFQEIVEGLTPALELPKSVMRRTVNIQEKISRIRDLMLAHSNVSFKNILQEAKDKTEVIVSFLALLELMKQREIIVRQERMFEDIIIEKIKDTNIRMGTNDTNAYE